MSDGGELRTPRLCLRRWRATDAAPFAAMNADPRVMEHFPTVLSRAQSDALLARITAHLEEHGFGLWAVEIPGVAPLVDCMRRGRRRRHRTGLARLIPGLTVLPMEGP